MGNAVHQLRFKFGRRHCPSHCKLARLNSRALYDPRFGVKTIYKVRSVDLLILLTVWPRSWHPFAIKAHNSKPGLGSFRKQTSIYGKRPPVHLRVVNSTPCRALSIITSIEDGRLATYRIHPLDLSTLYRQVCPPSTDHRVPTTMREDKATGRPAATGSTNRSRITTISCDSSRHGSQN